MDSDMMPAMAHNMNNRVLQCITIELQRASSATVLPQSAVSLALRRRNSWQFATQNGSNLLCRAAVVPETGSAAACLTKRLTLRQSTNQYFLS